MNKENKALAEIAITELLDAISETLKSGENSETISRNVYNLSSAIANLR